MKKILIGFMFIAIVFGVIGCNQDQAAFAQKALRLAAMDYGYRVADKFTWGQQEQAYYDLIMKGEIDLDMVDLVTAYLREHFANPVVARGFAELLVDAGISFDALGNVVNIDGIKIEMVQAIADGFKTGLELKNP